MTLLDIITKVQRVLITRSPYLRRVCNSVWCARLQNLPRKALLKKFKFLINHSALHTIIKCFNRGLFANDRDILHIVYDEIMQRGLQNTAYVQNIVNRYTEQRGK